MVGDRCAKLDQWEAQIGHRVFGEMNDGPFLALGYTATGTTTAICSLPGEAMERRQVFKPFIEVAPLVPDRSLVRSYLERHPGLAGSYPRRL
jgi:hypothetical protein